MPSRASGDRPRQGRVGGRLRRDDHSLERQRLVEHPPRAGQRCSAESAAARRTTSGSWRRRTSILHGAGFQGGAASFTLVGPVVAKQPPQRARDHAYEACGARPPAACSSAASKRTSPQNSLWRRLPAGDAGDEARASGVGGRVDVLQGGWPCTRSPASGERARTISGSLVLAAVRRSKGTVGNGGGAEQWGSYRTTLTTAELNGIWGSSASDVWIVGKGGTIRHWSNDSTERWAIVTSPTTNDCMRCGGPSPNNAWAVGDAGTILHWDGKAWTTLPRPSGRTKPRLYGVWGSGPNDVWVVGEAIALHFTGAKSGETGRCAVNAPASSTNPLHRAPRLGPHRASDCVLEQRRQALRQRRGKPDASAPDTSANGETDAPADEPDATHGDLDAGTDADSAARKAHVLRRRVLSHRSSAQRHG